MSIFQLIYAYIAILVEVASLSSQELIILIVLVVRIHCYKEETIFESVTLLLRIL
jgi:hypothetical protein